MRPMHRSKPCSPGRAKKRSVADRIDYTLHYGQWHDTSDAHFEHMAGYFADKLRPLLPPDKGARLLEIGCGMGFALSGLQKLGYSRIEGMDADAGQVGLALQRSLPVKHVPVGRFDRFMAARPMAFDAVLAIDVLEHVPVPLQPRFLGAVVNVLKPGGSFVCQVPNANSGVAARLRYIDWTHQCSFAETSLHFLLRNAGFVDVAISEADPNRRPRLWFIPRRSVLRWALLGTIRSLRRLELGLEVGSTKAIPLTPNMLATARRP